MFNAVKGSQFSFLFINIDMSGWGMLNRHSVFLSFSQSNDHVHLLLFVVDVTGTRFVLF